MILPFRIQNIIMQHYLHLSNSSPDTPAHPDFWIRTLLNVNIISTDWANWLISTATTLFHGWLQVRQGRLISADGVLYPSNYHHYPTLSRTRLLRFRCLDFFTSTTCFFFNRWLYILILYLVCMHTQRSVCELYCFGVCVCVSPSWFCLSPSHMRTAALASLPLKCSADTPPSFFGTIDCFEPLPGLPPVCIIRFQEVMINEQHCLAGLL